MEPGEIDDSVATTAHMYQARVDTSADLRVTVIGEHLFCVRIDSGGLLDWRHDYTTHTYTAIEPPDGLAERIRAY